MKNGTKLLRIALVGTSLASLAGGCYKTMHVGKYRLTDNTYEYIVDRAGEKIDREELNHFCEKFAGRDNYLTQEEAEEGFKSLSAGSPHQ